MGYVAKNLLNNNEQIIHEGKMHWFVVQVWIFLFFILNITIYNLDGPDDENAKILLIIIAFFFCPIGFLASIFRQYSTEFVITNKRIISKAGVISRKTQEINLNRIESVSVDQDAFGRMLGYGTLTIRGTGGAKTSLEYMSSPFSFRKHAINTLDQERDSINAGKQE